MWKIQNLTNNHFTVITFFIWGVALTILYSIPAYDAFHEDPRETQFFIHSMLGTLTAVCFVLFSLHKRFFSLLGTVSSLVLLSISGFYNWGDTSFIMTSSTIFAVMLLLPSIGLIYLAYWHENSKESEVVEQEGSKKYILFVLLLIALLLLIVGLFGFGVETNINLG